MHRLFLVHELLVIICEHLYDEDDIPNASKEALARLARTCKAFHAVALNALWSNLDGVAPLIQCLPAEVTRLYWQSGTAVVGIERAPRKAEWDIIQGYASRVQRLRVLNPSSCPAVKVITLPSSPPGCLIPNMLRTWNHLEEVTCGEIDIVIFRHLAKQTYLRKLAFTLSQSISQDLTDHPLSPRTFSRLRELEVHAPELPSLIDFMQKLEIHPICIRGRVDAGPTPCDMRVFFAFLTEHYVGVKLQNISLQSLPGIRMLSVAQPPLLSPTGNRVNGQPSHTGIHGSNFMPLAQFGSIDTLVIDVNCSIHLTDEDLASLAAAWPHLRTLSINKMHGWVTLCIAIDTDTFTEVPLDRPGGGVQNMNIRTLAFADSVIQLHATTVVAAFLSDIFPRLNEVTAWKSDRMRTRRDVDPIVHATRWEGVSQEIRGMIRIRQQERRWRRNE
ncbi:hypothetical protein EV424DRAFT_1411924 [Suillus variegatus]|nr:hypothetical protein EV424DRAFT_1411924 [Suillus variegatus]